MRKEREITVEAMESLRVRIAQERLNLREQLAAQAPTRGKAKRNTRKRLRQVFAVWHDLTGE
jgi:hypothetical protein